MNLFNNNNTQNRITTPMMTRSSANQSQPSSQNQPAGEPRTQQNQPQRTNPINVPQPQIRPNQLQNLPSQGIEKPKPLLFKQLWKLIERDPQRAMQILQRPSVKEAFRMSLEYFDKSAQKKQKYEKQHSKVQNFGFGVRQMGEQFKKFKCDNIAFLWKSLVENVSLICNVNQLLISGYLSNYLASNSIYASALTVKQFYCGNYIRVPNKSFIECLLTTNLQTKQRTISLENLFFLEIIEYLFNEIYFEHLAMLRIINYLQKKQKAQEQEEKRPRQAAQSEQKKYFIEIIKKGNCDFFTVLWKKLKQFSVAGIKKQLDVDTPQSKKIKQFFLSTKKYGIERKLWRHKIAVRMAIGGSLVLGLSEFGSWEKQPKISALIDYKQAIKFIDSDLEAFVTQRSELPSKQFNYARSNLQILLLVIPLHSFYKKPTQNAQARQLQNLINTIRETKSLYLESFRFLIWIVPFLERAKNVNNQNYQNNMKIEEKWLKIPQNVIWMMKNHLWREWLGIVLGAFQNYDGLFQLGQLLLHIVKMCKNVVQIYLDEFWNENPRHGLAQIKRFLNSCVSNKKVKPFLPVFIKLLGSDYNKLCYTNLTWDMLGLQVIKASIRDEIMQNLNITDKSVSSMNLSMFYSHNNDNSLTQNGQSTEPLKILESYPEQELKFLCKVIENSKQNLTNIQPFLFQCQIYESTGILTCKFLFQCLSKLRDYKAPALKCMRYIINAIDSLFVYVYTRQALMISISLSFSQWGESGRNQLYDMVSFVCMKASVSEQFRQSQKLKRAISNHLCNITRKSKYLSQYFPIKQDLRDEKLFIELHTLIAHKNHSALSEWYQKNSDHLQYRVTQWYTTLLLTLQGSQLLPIDLQTIRLLIEKMQVDKNWQHEYSRMVSILQILNKCPIIQSILVTLQPRLSGKNGQRHHFRSILGLTNAKLIQFIQLNNIQGNEIYKYTNKQDQSFEKSQEKRRIRYKKQKQTIVGCISGSLQLIRLILTMYNNINKLPAIYSTKYQLIQNLLIYKQVKQGLIDKNQIFHYRVPFNKNQYISKQSLTININKTHNDQQRILEITQPAVPINLVQVIASHLNFQKYFFLSFQNHENKNYREQDLIFDNYARVSEQNTQFFNFNNILGLDENQLTLQTDYTIGIGTTLRLLTQLIVTQNGSSLLYHCVANHDYLLARETINSNLLLENRHKFTILIRECVKMLDENSNNEQIQVILQFLTIGLNQSYYFAQQILQNQCLIALRRSIKQILQSCDCADDLTIVNQISLFVLAVLQHRDSHPDEVDMFVKLPTSIIEDLMKLLTMMQSSMQKLFRIKEVETDSIFLNIDYQRKKSKAILYHGAVHICFEMLKRFYNEQSGQQNIQFMQYVSKLTYLILEIPSKPQTNYVKLYKLDEKNTIVINNTSQICLQNNLNVNMYRQKYKFKGLATFIGFLPSLRMQYGRNYQFNVNHLFSRAIYAFFKVKNQINKLVIAAYQVNYMASLVNTHNEMVNSILSFLLMATTTGLYGHLLSIQSEDSILYNYIADAQRPGNSQKLIKTGIIEVKNLYKNKRKQQSQIKMIFGHSHQQCLSTKITLIQVLRQYFQKDHQKQYTNDIVVYTMSLLLNSLTQYWKLGSLFASGTKNLLNQVLDSTLLNFRISPQIYTIFIDSIVKCSMCCPEMATRSSYLLQKICQIIENILVYGRNMVDSSISSIISISQTIYNETSLQQNIFLISAILIKIINGAPDHTLNLYSNANENEGALYLSHTKNLIIHITKTILEKYLLNFQSIDLTNMMIMKLLNTLINNLGVIKDSDHNTQEHQQQNIMMMDIVGKYVRYLIKALTSNSNCSLFGSYLTESLTIVHDCQTLRDLGCSTAVMDFISTQFNTNIAKGMDNKISVNSHENQDVMRNFSEYNSTVSKTKPKRILQMNNKILYFQKLISNNVYDSNKLCLSQIVEVKEIFNLLYSICSCQFYWTNQKYSSVVESIFNSLINQTFIYQIFDSCRQSSNRLLQTRIPIQNQSQDRLMSIQVEQLQSQRDRAQFDEQNYLRLRQKDKDRQGYESRPKFNGSEGKKTTLFQFCVHVQMCHSIYDFLTTLSECLQKSQSLKRFYNKILNNGLNHIDQFVWQKLSNTFQCIKNFLNEICISYVRYYPKSLVKLLPMYAFVRNNTDFGYDTDFLNICFGDAGISGYASADLHEQYRNFIMDIILIFCQCSIKFIQTWKANDWKSSVNWQQARNKLSRQVLDIFKAGNNFVITRSYEYEEGEKIKRVYQWFDVNKIN